MTDAPERIWAVVGLGEVLSFNAYENGGTEYIRADIAQAETKSKWEWIDKHSDVRVGDEYADINFFRNTETGEIRAEVD